MTQHPLLTNLSIVFHNQMDKQHHSNIVNLYRVKALLALNAELHAQDDYTRNIDKTSERKLLNAYSIASKKAIKACKDFFKARDNCFTREYSVGLKM